MLNFIDYYLDRITMYRLVLYSLIFWLACGLVLALFGQMSFSPLSLIFSTGVLLFFSYAANAVSAKYFNLPASSESVYITALILALIITPPANAFSVGNLLFLSAAAIFAQASKYALNLGNKHIFNPAAFGVAVTYFAIDRSASWWVGTGPMFLFVLIGSLLVVRKTRRFSAVLAFLLSAVIVVGAFGSGAEIASLEKVFLASPLIFFAGIILTEPLTMPPFRDGQIAYGILVGWLFAPPTHFGSFYFTPELALLAGNLFSYVISPKGRFVLALREKLQAAQGVGDFVFEITGKNFRFLPGQYMEFTLGHKPSDSRGNRRYLTIASSPTEKELRLGVKFYEKPSSFKRALLELKSGGRVIAGQLAGDFTLPRDPKQKLAFIAGGIGVTPFRSMVKYLLDKTERRDVVLFYSNRSIREIAYHDVFSQAEISLGLKPVYTLTEPQHVPAGWAGETGYVDAKMIARQAPDFLERTFYISGTHEMVKSLKNVLRKMGVPRGQIKTDFFPGLA